jgi:hypothetical protein
MGIKWSEIGKKKKKNSPYNIKLKQDGATVSLWASVLERAQFESQPGHPLPSMRFYLIFLSSSRQMPG